jgi:hypothetical protein
MSVAACRTEPAPAAAGHGGRVSDQPGKPGPLPPLASADDLRVLAAYAGVNWVTTRERDLWAACRREGTVRLLTAGELGLRLSAELADLLAGAEREQL